MLIETEVFMPLTAFQKEFISKLISIPSVGGNPEAGAPYGLMPRKALGYFIDEATKAGFRTGVTGDRAGWVEFGSGDRLIGIVCHLDVVPEGDGWNTPPFELTIKDDENGNPSMYGRGIIDDKGPACASFFAMKELLEEGRIPEGYRVRLILGTDEERTCSCVEYYSEHEEIPEFSITPDAEFPAIYCEKGLLHVEILDKNTNGLWVEGGSAPNMVPAAARCVAGCKEIKATGKMAHASKPELGINAISLLADAMEEQNIDLNDYPVMKFIKDFDAKSFTGCTVTDDSGSITSNIGVLRTTDDGISLIIDFRIPYTADKDESVFLNLKKKAEEYGLTARIDHYSPHIHKDKNSPSIHNLTKIWKEHMDRFTGFKEEYRALHTEAKAIGGGTYARYIPNTVAFGIQTPWAEDQCHQANEHIPVSDFLQWIAIIKEYIETIS